MEPLDEFRLVCKQLFDQREHEYVEAHKKAKTDKPKSDPDQPSFQDKAASIQVSSLLYRMANKNPKAKIKPEDEEPI